MRLSLYIDDQLADLGPEGSEALILWTFTRDDADNPSTVINSYTKTVTLPATDANDTIFNHAGQYDRHTISGVFQSMKRTPFSIIAEDGRKLEAGYLKLDKVNRKGVVVVSYDITLYGGLGSLLFFYAFNADGSRKTLADFNYPRARNDAYTYPADELRISAKASDVADAWAAIFQDDLDRDIFGLINFAPCYNGIPSGTFDAKSAYYKPGTAYTGELWGIRLVYQDPDDQLQYDLPDDGDGGLLVDLGREATEWEVQDLRAWQQRPVISVLRLLEAMVHQDNQPNAYYSLVLDPGFFRDDNPLFYRAWITLPLQEDDSAVTAADFLKGTGSPADYLLSIAKAYGLVFITDPAAGTVTLTDRNTYYANGGLYATDIDISDRIDTSQGVPMRPFLATSRVYEFEHPTDGAWAKTYRDRYGRIYGGFRVDSGLEFDGSTVDVLKGGVFCGCADVQEDSAFYNVSEQTVRPVGGTPFSVPRVKFAYYGSAEYTLYNGADSKALKPESGFWTGSYTPGIRPQFHDSANKPVSGKNVLLFLNGMSPVPAVTANHPNLPSQRADWHLSDDNAAMLALNGGKPCWDISPTEGVIQLTSLPSFRRWFIDGNTIATSFDFGVPEEVAFPGSVEGNAVTLYARRWQAYIEDRFDQDTTVMRCRVNLAGLDPGPQLLRRFFWYGGSVWSLNRIEDYNPANPGVTLCEFVRVQDKANYYDNQTLYQE